VVLERHYFIKIFLEPVQPSVGSSGARETLHGPHLGVHTTSRVIFTSPYSTPSLDRSHDTHQ